MEYLLLGLIGIVIFLIGIVIGAWLMYHETMRLLKILEKYVPALNEQMPPEAMEELRNTRWLGLFKLPLT